MIHATRLCAFVLVLASTGCMQGQSPHHDDSSRETAEAGLSPQTNQIPGAKTLQAETASLQLAAMPYPAPAPVVDRERYAHFEDNGWTVCAESPVSTFSIDVDTGSYANVRRILGEGRLPPMDAVRAEEMINYFDYDYPDAAASGRPFTVTTEAGPTPWNSKTRLIEIGLRGVSASATPSRASNLVFLVDVSGSMRAAAKLDLLKSALRLLAGQLGENDRISLVVYAGASGVVLEPTPGSDRARILNAIDGLAAGGSTNGGEGIRLAYRMARQGYVPGGINRILLATDGDFNVGTVDFEQLLDIVERERESGVSLTTLGFGGGNYNDHLMEQLADAGNGNHAYIDTLNEARKVLVQERHSTFETIASDVKIQVEFNPAQVAEYRLIGYENRVLEREDFNNDKVDAGEIGAGHTVTALYEITLATQDYRRIEPLRYGAVNPQGAAPAEELGYLKLRYKLPGESESRLMAEPIGAGEIIDELSTTTDDFRFAAAVSAFAQLLRGGEELGVFDYADVLELARGARGADPFGYRGEFLSMVALAGSLKGGPAPAD